MYAQLVSLNGTDISQYLNESSYKVEPVPVYDEWTDGRHRKHKHKFRTRAQGGFDVFCFSDTDYDTLLALFAENTDDEGLTTITVYVGGNVNDDVEIQAYCRMNLEYRKTVSATVTKYKLHVEVEEQ